MRQTNLSMELSLLPERVAAVREFGWSDAQLSRFLFRYLDASDANHILSNSSLELLKAVKSKINLSPDNYEAASEFLIALISRPGLNAINRNIDFDILIDALFSKS